MAAGRRPTRAAALWAPLLALGALSPAAAQVVEFGLEAEATGRAAAAYAANALVSCDSADERCRGVRAGQIDIQNTQIEMRFIDIDPPALGDIDGDGRDDTANASAATLALPADAEVTRALLYVGGIWSVDNVDRCGETRAVPAEDRTRIRFSPPGAAQYVELDGALLGEDDQSVGAGYAAVFDVTEHVSGPGEVWVADAALIEGQCAGGGWALAVIHRTPAGPPRRVALYAGYARVNIDTRITAAVDGLLTPVAGAVTAEIAAGAIEGDRGLEGDQVTLDGAPLSDAANPEADFFNSSVAHAGENIADRTPAHLNNIAFDFDVVDAGAAMPNGARRIELGISTDRDIVKAFFVGISAEVAVPRVELAKSVEVVDGADEVATVGDRLRYTLEARVPVDEPDPVVALELVDPLPPGVAWIDAPIELRAAGGDFGPAGDAAAYDPQSHTLTARAPAALDPGASVALRFEVEVVPGAGPRIENTARATWTGATAGPDVVVAATSDGDPEVPGAQPTTVAVLVPDLGPAADLGVADGGDPMPGPDAGPRDEGVLPDPDAAYPPDGALDAGADARIGSVEGLLADGEEAGGGLIFGCSTGGGAPGPLPWLLVLVCALRRRRSAAWLLALTALAAGLPDTAEAGERFAVQRFAPNTDPRHHGLALVSARPHDGPQWSAALLLDHADDPLVVRADGERGRSLVAGHTRGHLLASGALTGWAEVGVAVPIMLDASGEAVADGPGLGDLRIQSRFVVWQADEDRPRDAIAIAFDAFLGTGDPEAFSGDGIRFEPRLATAHRLGNVDLRANLGWHFREAARLGNVEIDDMLTFGIGADIPLATDWALAPELAGALSALADELDAGDAPIEALLSARWSPDRAWSALLGFGAGLVPGAGVPDWRVVIGFGYTRALPPAL